MDFKKIWTFVHGEYLVKIKWWYLLDVKKKHAMHLTIALEALGAKYPLEVGFAPLQMALCHSEYGNGYGTPNSFSSENAKKT